MIHRYIESPEEESYYSRSWALPIYRSRASLGTPPSTLNIKVKNNPSHSIVHQKLGVGNFDQELKFTDMVTGFNVSSLINN